MSKEKLPDVYEENKKVFKLLTVIKNSLEELLIFFHILLFFFHHYFLYNKKVWLKK